MLSKMNSTKLITFYYEDKKWEWDLPGIAALNVLEDVAMFLLEDLHKRNFSISLLIKVPLETRDVLRIAACLGDTTFSLILLSRLMNLPHIEVSRRLRPAEDMGLIFSHQSYKVQR
jgi:predicted ATPase